MPATSANAEAPARHSPRRERRRSETTLPFIRYAISTDCVCFTGNLAAVIFGGETALRFYGTPSREGRRRFGRKIGPAVARTKTVRPGTRTKEAVQNIFRTHRAATQQAAEHRGDARVTVPRRD